MDELVSVIIPTYKRASYLKRCLESVLDQTYKNIEIIVVDDNEPESEYRIKTEEILNSFISNPKINYIKHSNNRNGSAARNTGIKFAKGSYIAFLDDDDYFFSTKIQEQVDLIKLSAGNVKACYCKCEKYINGKKIYETTYTKSGNLQLDMLLLDVEINGGSTLLVEKKSILEIKGFDERFVRHQDVEFLINFFRKNEIICLPKVLVRLNVDSRENKLNPDRLKEVKELLLETYQKDIALYPPNIQKKIYASHWFDLFKVYLINREFSQAVYYLLKAKPNLNMLLKFFIHLYRKLKEKRFT